jgi:hypothetical protein
MNYKTGFVKEFEVQKITFNVISYQIKEKIEANTLTWLQKLICKWFKIKPESKYWYIVKVKIDPPNATLVGALINDCCIGLDGNKWRVYNIYYIDKQQNIELQNIEPLLDINGIYGQMVIFSRMYEE